MLAYVYIPFIQRELDIFRTDVWNGKRSGTNPKKAITTGNPDFLYENPETHGYEGCGLKIENEDIIAVLEDYPNIFENDDFLDERKRMVFESILPKREEIAAKDAHQAYRKLEEQYTQLNSSSSSDSSSSDPLSSDSSTCDPSPSDKRL